MENLERFRMNERVKKLIDSGYQQVSRRYRILARLPEGKTGLEALLIADERFARDLMDNLERQCTEQYLRVYAPKELQEILTNEEFDEYLWQTGRKAMRKEV